MAAGEDEHAGEREARALMALLHYVEAASIERPEMQLDLRARRVVQSLGLAGAMPLAAVGQRLGVAPSTMTGLADRVERLGYVRRRPHPSDRRASVLELTAKGRRLFDQETAFYRRLIDRTLGSLDAGARDDVLEALRRLPADPEAIED